jgi:hypothetical protein
MMRAPKKRMTVSQLQTHMNRRLTRFERRVNRRFQAVDRRFDAMDAQFAEVTRRFDSLGEQLDANTRGIREQIDATDKRLSHRLDHHFEIFHEHEDRIQIVERAASR